jgi:ABC-type Na+ efflux pump permease subunit
VYVVMGVYNGWLGHVAFGFDCFCSFIGTFLFSLLVVGVWVLGGITSFSGRLLFEFLGPSIISIFLSVGVAVAIVHAKTQHSTILKWTRGNCLLFFCLSLFGLTMCEMSV